MHHTNPKPKAPSLDYLNGVRAKFQLPPQPLGVQKIAGLVKGKDDSSMEEIVQIIAPDRMVTQRLISMAFPKASAREGATVEMATSRLGLGRVIVMVVADLLTEAVLETFETMVSLTLKSDDPAQMPTPDPSYSTGSVKFSGKTKGKVTLTFSPHLSLWITARLMGGNLEDKYPPEVVNDALGEIVNIITGNLQSRLCDAGLTSEVELPVVKRHSFLAKETIPGGSTEQFYFRQGIHGLGVNLCISPFAA